jgi:hypothetical protein
MYDPCVLASRLLKNDVEAMGTQEFRMSQADGKLHRVFKKTVQQGRSERRGEAYASVR